MRMSVCTTRSSKTQVRFEHHLAVSQFSVTELRSSGSHGLGGILDFRFWMLRAPEIREFNGPLLLAMGHFPLGIWDLVMRLAGQAPSC